MPKDQFDAGLKLRGVPAARRSTSKSASRALDVLEYFGRVRKPLRARQVARSLDLHPSSVDQLLKTMAASGYLIFDSIRKVYHPSPRLVGFASWLTSDCFWNADTSSILREIAAQTGGYACLAGRGVNSLQLMDAYTMNVDFPTEIGVPVPLYMTIGQAFLAGCTDEEAKRIIDRAILYRQLPQGTNDLMDRVRMVRSKGYASGQSLHQQSWVIAVPIPLGKWAPNESVVLAAAGAKERIRSAESEIVDIIRQKVSPMLAALRDRAPRVMPS